MKTGDVRNTTNTLSATGNVLTSTVNGVADSYDLTSILGNAVLTTQDDQVMTTDANSPIDMQWTPTTTTPDPDGQGSRTDYTVSATIKPTYICNGKAINTTDNQVLTSGSLLNNPAPADIRDYDPTLDQMPYIQAWRSRNGCGEDTFVPFFIDQPRRSIDAAAHDGVVFAP